MQRCLMSSIRALEKQGHDEIRNVLEGIRNESPNVGKDSTGMIRRNFDVVVGRLLGESFGKLGSMDEVAKLGQRVGRVAGIRFDCWIVHDFDGSDDAAAPIDGEVVVVPPSVSARGGVDDAGGLGAVCDDIGQKPFGEDVWSEMVDLEAFVVALAGEVATDFGHSRVVDEEVDAGRRSILVCVGRPR